MGASSSSNKGVASRSRFSSWGSSIDETCFGDGALCGDYPDDDLEGFPLVSGAGPSRRASVITNPYIEATPRQRPKLRRAFSEGEASVRRAYTTDYSDNDDDPDTDDDFFNNPNMVRKSRAGIMHDDYEHDDFPNRPFPLPVTTSRYDADAPQRSRSKRHRKKAPRRHSEYHGRRPFSPSQLSAAPTQKHPKKKNRRSSMPRPESEYAPRRYSMPETIPITSHSRRYSAFEADRDPYGNVESPLYSAPIKKKPKKPKARSASNIPKNEDDDWLSGYNLPNQVPADSYGTSYKRNSYFPISKPIKPITKTRKYDKEPNYKVPTTPKGGRRKKSQGPKRPKKKAPHFPTPQYGGLPQQYEPILQSAPPIRKGARIKAPAAQGSNYAPTPFVVGRTKHPKTPYLVSHNYD